MNQAFSVLSLLIVVGSSTIAAAERPTVGDFKCYYGVLHAHSVLSPDFKPQVDRTQLKNQLANNDPELFNLANGPVAAWKRAANAAKVDFLALTEHKHGPEGGSEPCAHEMPPGGYQFLKNAADRINTDPQFTGKFLAIPAMEWSTIGKGNHVNIFFANKAVPDQINSGDFTRLVDDYLNHASFEKDNPLLLVQMNHPNANSGNMKKNYGRGQFPDGNNGTKQFVKKLSPFYFGIEHVNNSDIGNGNEEEVNAHRNGNSLERFYRAYLNMGFRIAPTAGHDNHRATWGRHTAARTGVWAKELTPASFVEACRVRRVFVSEDNELAVALRTEDDWMGSVVTVPANGEWRTFRVNVDQLTDTDTGEDIDEGPFTVTLIGDEDGVGGNLPGPRWVKFGSQWKENVWVRQGGSVFFSRYVKPGSYYYVHVKEQQGQDSGGENADAWTAPIWFESE